jgi:DNA-directed RNA polymerase sigma subunit (sigma70/sigma32)
MATLQDSVKKAVKQRNADIVRRRKKGETFDSIAKAVGLTRQRVMQIHKEQAK